MKTPCGRKPEAYFFCSSPAFLQTIVDRDTAIPHWEFTLRTEESRRVVMEMFHNSRAARAHMNHPLSIAGSSKKHSSWNSLFELLRLGGWIVGMISGKKCI